MVAHGAVAKKQNQLNLFQHKKEIGKLCFELGRVVADNLVERVRPQQSALLLHHVVEQECPLVRGDRVRRLVPN